MESCVVVSIIAIPVCVLSILAHYFYFRLGKRILPEEEGRTPLFQERCGGRFDALNLTSPFVRFAIYDDFFVVVYGKTHHVVKFDELEKIEIKRFLVSKGLVVHRKSKRSPFVFIIWSRSPQEAGEILEHKGVRVIFA